MSLLSGMLAVSLISAMLGSIMMNINAFNDLDKNNLKITAQLIGYNTGQVISDSTAWTATLASGANGSLDCIKNSDDCIAVATAPGVFNPIEEIFFGTNLAHFLDTRELDTGFNFQGNDSCSEFGSVIGESSCPFRVEVGWRPLCDSDDPGCGTPQMELNILVKFSGGSAKKFNIAPFQKTVLL